MTDPTPTPFKKSKILFLHVCTHDRDFSSIFLQKCVCTQFETSLFPFCTLFVHFWKPPFPLVFYRCLQKKCAQKKWQVYSKLWPFFGRMVACFCLQNQLNQATIQSSSRLLLYVMGQLSFCLHKAFQTVQKSLQNLTFFCPILIHIKFQ